MSNYRVVIHIHNFERIRALFPDCRIFGNYNFSQSILVYIVNVSEEDLSVLRLTMPVLSIKEVDERFSSVSDE